MTQHHPPCVSLPGCLLPCHVNLAAYFSADMKYAFFLLRQALYHLSHAPSHKASFFIGLFKVVFLMSPCIEEQSVNNSAS
jgi:flagellar biosynthesis protein FliP